MHSRLLITNPHLEAKQLLCYDSHQRRSTCCNRPLKGPVKRIDLHITTMQLIQWQAADTCLSNQSTQVP